MDQTLVRALVDLRDKTLQKSRIAFGNRLDAVERGADAMDKQTMDVITRWSDRFQALEDEATDDLNNLVEDEDIVEHMTAIKGIGLTLAAKVVAMVDIKRSDTVSQLWRYAGYGVKDGGCERPVTGEKLPYNKRLKTTLFLVGDSFIKSNSPYRRIYDEAKEYYTLNRPEWTKMHCHLAAKRKMIKVFLAHLWDRWRKLEGLPTESPYIIGKDGHGHYLKPEEFGWPELE